MLDPERLMLDPEVPLVVLLSPAAKASGVDASAIQQSAAAIGVRLRFMVCSYWNEVRIDRTAAQVAPLPARFMQRLFPQSRKRAALVPPHRVGYVIGADAQLALIVVMLTAAGTRAVRFRLRRGLGRLFLLVISSVDLRASVRILH